MTNKYSKYFKDHKLALLLLWEGDKGGDEKISIFEVNVFYMIQAHELRIGNLVKAGVMVEPIQVFTITFDRRDGYFINTHITIEDIQPIPLTPEILESLGLPDQEINEKGCGWFHRGNFLVGKTKYHYHFHKNSKRLTLAIVVTLEKGSDTTAFAWDIYYVHQLQNLYHALTFKELNVVDGKSYLCSR